MKRMRYVVLLICWISTFYSVKASAAARLKADLSKDTLEILHPGFHRMMLEEETTAAYIGIKTITDSVVLQRIAASHVNLPKRLSILAVGDIMPGTNYPKASYLPPDVKALFAPVRDLVLSAEIATGNLEGVMSDSGGTPKTCHDPDNCYVFRMPDEFAAVIKDAGFDLLGTANNHVNDFGPGGRMNTASILEKTGLHFAGFNDHPYTVFNAGGLRIAFCAFSPHTGTLSMTDYNGATRLVARLDTLYDLVVVAFHGGAEGREHQHVTREDEMFLGNNRGNVYRFAHSVIDAGADLVIGSGPHVVRAFEYYNGRLIAYSLGNFCTWARFNLSGPNALAPALQVWLNEDGSFAQARIYSFYQGGEGGPNMDPENRALKKIRDLTLQDFPNGGISFDDDGWVKPGKK